VGVEGSGSKVGGLRVSRPNSPIRAFPHISRIPDAWLRRDPEALCESAEEKLLNAKGLAKMAEETVVEAQFSASVGEVQDSVGASHFSRPIVCVYGQLQIRARARP
jgi:hypothetical protein